MTEFSFLCEFHTERDRLSLSAISLCDWMDSCPCVVVTDTCHQEVFLRHTLRELNMEWGKQPLYMPILITPSDADRRRLKLRRVLSDQCVNPVGVFVQLAKNSVNWPYSNQSVIPAFHTFYTLRLLTWLDLIHLNNRKVYRTVCYHTVAQTAWHYIETPRSWFPGNAWTDKKKCLPQA